VRTPTIIAISQWGILDLSFGIMAPMKPAKTLNVRKKGFITI
jgi:hypothetical protein